MEADTAVLDLDLTGEAFVPHQWLLPRCRGIVHHGGSGTTGAAMRLYSSFSSTYVQYLLYAEVVHVR